MIPRANHYQILKLEVEKNYPSRPSPKMAMNRICVEMLTTIMTLLRLMLKATEGFYVGLAMQP